MRSSRKYLDESYTKLFQIDQPQPNIKQRKILIIIQLMKQAHMRDQKNGHHRIIIHTKQIYYKSKKNIKKIKVVMKTHEVDY